MGNDNLITLDFNGKALETFQSNGEAWVSVRSIANGIGLHVEAQRKKLLKNEKKFSCSLKRVTASDSKEYETHCIPVKKVPGWLFTIDPERVKPEIKPTVELYQEKCFEVLHDYWQGQKPEPAQQQATLPAIPKKKTLQSARLILVWSNGDIQDKPANPANIEKVLAQLAPKWGLFDVEGVARCVDPLRDSMVRAIDLWGDLKESIDKRQQIMG